ncbi:hypothetical protein L3Q82_013201, partial [Scortum barcoo]
SFTDLRRAHSLFSLATPSAFNDLLIYKEQTGSEISLNIRNQAVIFAGQDYKLNTWHSVCSTWDSASGLVQLWLDGKPSSRRFSSESNINGPIIIVLGQVQFSSTIKRIKEFNVMDQDSHGGAFDINQSFVGMMSDVHMWDYTLSPCEIQNYTDDLNFTPGNVLNWRALLFQIVGRVLIEDKQKACR